MAMRPRGGGAGPDQVYRPPRAAIRPVFEDFRPASERQQEEEAEKLLIYLPGFMKENLRVSTEGKNTVRVRGERFVAGNKWNRFQEDHQAPDDCNMRSVHAKFENGILTITMPRKIPKKFDEPTKQTPLTSPPPPPQTDDLRTKQTSITPPPPQKDDFPPITTHPTVETQRKPTHLKPTDQLAKPQNGDRDKDLRGVKEKKEDEKKILEGRVRSAAELSKTKKGDEDIDFPTLKTSTLEKTSGEKEKEKEIFEGQIGSTVESSETQKGDETLGLPPFKAPPLGTEQKIQKSKEEEKLDQHSTRLMKSGKEIEKKQSHEEAQGGKDTKKSKDSIMEFQERVEHEGSKEMESTSNAAAGTSSYHGVEFSIGNLKKSLVELNEERQLLVNAGAAVLVIMALGAYIYHSIGSGKAE